MAYIPGTTRSETLYGTSDGDSILGRGGHDTLFGYDGADVLRGGVGNDVLYSYSSYARDSDADRLFGEGGSDYLVVGGGDFAYGGVGRDTIEAAASEAPPALISGDGGYDTLILRSGSSIAGTRVAGIERLEGDTSYYTGGLAASQFSGFATVGAVKGQTTASFRLSAGGSGRINFDTALAEGHVYGSDAAQTLRVTEGAKTSFHYHGASGDGSSTIFGGIGNDSLEGSSAADSLRGGEGNDTLAGYGQGYYSDGVADDLRGGGGNDYIYASQYDRVYGDAGADTIEVRGYAPAFLNGGNGTDTLRVNNANISESFLGELERLVLIGNVRMDADQFSEFARISTDAGTTSVYITLEQGGTGQMLFDPSIETVRINGTSSADETLRMVGRGAPDVTYTGGSGRTLFEAGGGDDSLSGGAGADTLSGGAGNDTLAGYSWRYDDDVQDQLSGGDGDDFITAGTDDIVDGGSGNDRIEAYGAVRVTAGDGHDFILASAEDDRIDGGSGSDTVSYAGSRALTIDLNVTSQDTGGGGLDTLIGVENIIGGQYNDSITGTADANVLEGGYGDDTLVGGAGRDTASYSTSTSAVTVDLRVATAQQTGGAGIDLLSGFENLTGGSGNDSLYGDARSNVLIGGAGNDLLNGRLGFDIVSYETATERVQVSLAIRGAQPAGGTNGTDTITNVEGLRGTAFDDGLEGDNGANSLAGLAGNDTLTGGGGDDTLTGGGGIDRMRGGSGSDTFQFDRATDSSWDARDIILDFSRADGDRIDLSAIDARPLAGHQEFTFGSTRVGGLSLAESGTDTLVLGNTDLDRDFEIAIVIRDGAVRASSYTHDDFIWG